MIKPVKEEDGETLFGQPRHLTFIVNPVSGHRWSSKHRAIRAMLENESPSFGAPFVEVLVTKERGQATEWAKERRQDPNRMVIAVGGDGTVHEVATGLVGGRASLGVVPVGSGNDFASMLSVPLPMDRVNPDALVEFFQTAPSGLVDVGEASWTELDNTTHQAIFINSMGLGLEGAVAASVERLRAIKGMARYLVACLWQVCRYRPIDMRLTASCGGIPKDQALPKLLVAIGNGRRAGGGFLLQPNARIDDGLLDICWAQALPVWQQMRILPSVLSGRHGQYQGIHQAQIAAVRIDCPDGSPLHLDGELVSRAAKQVEVGLRPQAIRVVGFVSA